MKPGDVERQDPTPLGYLSGGLTTAEYRERLGHWGYWNFGPPDQPRDAALLSALSGLRTGADDGTPLPIPREALERGLVYLRATAGGFDEMIAAMHRVVDWTYGS